MRFRLEKIGRGEYSGEIAVGTSTALLHEVKRHLFSEIVAIHADGEVTVGIFPCRAVGRVVPVDDLAVVWWAAHYGIAQEEVPR